jgi:hypothetical protein
MKNARVAAARAGWLEWFGIWVFTDIARLDEYDRPAYFQGTARDLCLSQGIDFEE